MGKEGSQLSESDHRTVFERKILPLAGLDDLTTQQSPRAIILAGQPGAGKGSLAERTQAELSRDAVTVDPDSLRDLHPNVEELRKTYPYTWAEHTHSDASQWAKELRAAAIDGRKNLILDTTLGKAGSAVDLIRDLKSKGYEVEVRAVAAHSLESELGVDSRFASRFKDEGYGRYVPDSIRQQVYQALPGNLDKVHAETGVPIRIYSREGSELYDSRSDSRTPGIALDQGRESRLRDPRTTHALRDGWKDQAVWHRELPDALARDSGVSDATANAVLSERAEHKIAEGVARETTNAINVDHTVRVRPNMIRGAVIGGTVASAVEAVGEGRKIADLYGRDNPVGAEGAMLDFGARSVGGFAGAAIGAKIGTLVGIESGPGAIVTGLLGAGVGAMGASAAVDWIEKYQINNQADRTGRAWTFDPENPGAGWTRTEREIIGTVGTLADRPIYGATRQLTADPELAQELSYQAAGKTVGLRLGEPDVPISPYSIPGDATDTLSIYPRSWERDPQTGVWRREVVTSELEHGMKNVQIETADAQKAQSLDAYAADIIAHNAVRSPAAIARTYEALHAQQGWDRFGKVPEAVVFARDHTDQVLASDGRTYQRGDDGQWTHDGVLWDSRAHGNLRDELDATYQQIQARYARSADAPAPALAERSPTAIVPLAGAGQLPLDDVRQSAHPGNGTYTQMMDRVARFDAQQGVPTGELSQRLAASTAVIVTRERLDPERTFLEKSPQGGFALVERGRHGQQGERRIDIDVRTLSTRPIEESSRELAAARSPHYLEPAAPGRTVDQERSLQRMVPSDRAMFERIRASTPASVSDEAVVTALSASKQQGIDHADKIRSVVMEGDRLFVAGNTPGFRSMTDVSQPQPDLQHGVDQLQQGNQQREHEQRRQHNEEQQRTASQSSAMSM